MTGILNGKAIIVTGAGGGIGRATCLVLARAGARLAISDVAVEPGEETLVLVRALGGEAIFSRADTTSETDVAALTSQALTSFGRINGCFVNAGREGHNQLLADLTLEQFSRVVNVNLLGTFLCLKHMIPALLATGGGSVVITASALGQVGSPRAAEYCASKAGVIGLMKAAAVDYGDKGIRINAILPGIVKTPAIARMSAVPELFDMFETYRLRHSNKRFAEPEEIGETVSWLLSDASSYVHGSAMAVDGGFLSA